MSGLLLWKALAVWVLILIAAIANAGLRELVLAQRLGKVRALALSGVLLSLAILVIAFACLPWLGIQGPGGLLSIGAGWLALTAAFDAVLGRLQGKPLSSVLAAYTFKDGNLWPLILLVTLGAPYVAAKLRGWL